MNKKFKYASYSFIVTIAAIAIAVIIALIGDLLVDRFPISWDLTREGRYQISSETRTILNNLEQDVTIYQLIQGADTGRTGLDILDRTVDEILDNYRRTGSRIAVRQIDINRNPGFDQRFPSHPTALRVGDLVFVSGDRYRVVTARSLITEQTMTGAGFDVDRQFATAVVRVTDTRDVVLAFTTGHGEAQILEAGLGAILSDEGFVYSYIDLFTEDIADDVDTLVIIAPQRDFLESEIVKIDEFLNRGNTNLV